MPPPLVTIRPAVAADYDALCNLWRELDEHHRAARPELFRVPEGPRRERAWALELIAGPESAILVAEASDGALVGLAALKIEQPPALPVRVVRRHVELHNLVVAAGTRRSGVAGALVAEAVRWTAARGVEELELTVHEFNRTALAFYEDAGFQTSRRRLSLSVPPIAAAPAAHAVGEALSPC